MLKVNYHVQLYNAYVCIAAEFVLVSVLATILYRIGFTSVLNDPTDREEFDSKNELCLSLNEVKTESS